MLQPMLDLEALAAALHVQVELAQNALAVRGVDALGPLLQPAGQLGLAVTQDRFPARGEVRAAGGELPLPHAVIGASDCQRVALLALTPARLGLLAASRLLGQASARLPVEGGQFVEPTLDGVTAGLAGAEVADDLSYNPLDAAGDAAYPITAPTFILVKTKYDDAATAAAVKGFLTYLLGEGQELAKDVDFAPLPAALKDKALAQVDKIQG